METLQEPFPVSESRRQFIVRQSSPEISPRACSDYDLWIKPAHIIKGGTESRPDVRVSLILSGAILPESIGTTRSQALVRLSGRFKARAIVGPRLRSPPKVEHAESRHMMSDREPIMYLLFNQGVL